MIILDNGKIRAEISTLGGQLMSLKDSVSGREYLWNGDKAFWGGRSPVLFPFVGKTRNMEFIAKGKTWTAVKHGFARDMEFQLTDQKGTEEAWLLLCSSEETLRKYPYEFRLFLGYRLEGRSLQVLWKVENPAAETMYFSIGGHPGFFCPVKAGEKQTDYQIQFDTPEQVTVSVIGEGGLATDKRAVHALQDGKLDITENLFEKDALVIEHHQVHSVSFLKKGEAPYVTVTFDAPLFGVWAPFEKEVPFICIEPWYGRCDHENFTGTLEEREWGNELEAGCVWEASYKIHI